MQNHAAGLKKVVSDYVSGGVGYIDATASKNLLAHDRPKTLSIDLNGYYNNLVIDPGEEFLPAGEPGLQFGPFLGQRAGHELLRQAPHLRVQALHRLADLPSVIEI